MNLFKHSLLLCCAILFEFSLFAQPLYNSKSYQVGIGATTLLGDLGGSLGPGTNTVRDFDHQSIGHIMCVASDLGISKQFDFRIYLNYVFLKADDKNSEELTRRIRNLSVKTNVIEFIPSIKYYLTKNNAHRTALSPRKKNMSVYASLGLGLIYFNPRAEFEGKSYNLRTLRTEGQGLEGGAKTYSGFSIIVPFTLGFEHKLNKNSSICYEFAFRKSFTDYLDDVSTVYFDNASLASFEGLLSAELADRNLGNQPNSKGVTRGNPKSKDNYFTFTIGCKKALKRFESRRK